MTASSTLKAEAAALPATDSSKLTMTAAAAKIDSLLPWVDYVNGWVNLFGVVFVPPSLPTLPPPTATTKPVTVGS